MQCRKCGYVWEPNPLMWRKPYEMDTDKFLKCPKCYNWNRLSKEFINDHMIELEQTQNFQPLDGRSKSLSEKKNFSLTSPKQSKEAAATATQPNSSSLTNKPENFKPSIPEQLAKYLSSGEKE